MGSLISKEAAAKYLEVLRPGDREQEEETPKSEEWDSYKHDVVDYYKTFSDVSEKIDAFANDPLVPTAISKQIVELGEVLHDGLSDIGATLTRVSQDLPEHYPTLDSLKKADVRWVSNEYDSKDRVFNKLDDLRRSIRVYLKSDQLLDI